MQLTVQRPVLADALALALRAVATKSTLPVLSHVILDASAERLELRASNLDLAMTVDCPARIAAPGRVTVPAHLFADWVRAVIGDEVTVTLGGKRAHDLRVVSGRATATMRGQDPDDFPRLPTAADEPLFSLPSAALRTAIQATEFCAGDPSRPVLQGLLVCVSGEGLILAGADGFRLAEARAPLPETAATAWQGIIPAQALRELMRLLPDDGAVALHTVSKGNQCVFRTEGAALYTRLIEGEWPAYQKIVPQTWTTRAVVNRQAALRAVRAANVFAHDNSMIVSLALVPGPESLAPGHLDFRATSHEIGGHEDAIDAAVDGTGGSIAFNGRYLLQALEALPTEQVAVEMTSAASPGVVRPVGQDGALYVIMPMEAKEVSRRAQAAVRPAAEPVAAASCRRPRRAQSGGSGARSVGAS